MKKRLPLTTPGEILAEEFLRPMEISQSQLARDIDVPQRRVNEIVRGKRAITPDTALRLARYFGTSPEFWMNMENTYQVRLLEQERHRIYAALPSASHAG